MTFEGTRHFERFVAAINQNRSWFTKWRPSEDQKTAYVAGYWQGRKDEINARLSGEFPVISGERTSCGKSGETACVPTLAQCSVKRGVLATPTSHTRCNSEQPHNKYYVKGEKNE